jgi:Na+-transporting NADH:ubiquinone oxidoreductase subunit NqrC
MTDWTGLAQVVTALGLLVTAIFSGVATILAAKAKHQATEAKEQAIATHTAVNSRMDEFKRLFEQVFIQKGVAQEVEKQRIRETDTGGMALLAEAEVKVLALMKEATDTAAKLLADARQVALVNQGTNPIPVQVVGPGVDTPLKVIAEDK